MKTSKRYNITVKCHCRCCMKDHRVLYSTLSYRAATPLEAARSALEYLAYGGSYCDLGHLAKDKTIFFEVKERGTPRGTGITIVERAQLGM